MQSGDDQSHFLIIRIYYLDLPNMVFDILLFTITLQVTSWYFWHFLEDSGMLVWYSMLNTIPENGTGVTFPEM